MSDPNPTKTESGWGTPNQAKALVILLVVLGLVIVMGVWLAAQAGNSL